MTSFDKEAITMKSKELMFIIRLADAEYFYICIGNYLILSSIWKKQAQVKFLYLLVFNFSSAYSFQIEREKSCD